MNRLFLRRCGELTSGLAVWNVTDYAFDYALYPFVVWKLGPVVGGGIMALASLVFCLVLLRIYDGFKRDWLGIEFVKGLRHYDGISRWRRGLAWLLARGDGVAFVVLSAKYDPFITTAYMRCGAFTSMTSRDWGIFLGSWVIGNGEWILVLSGGIWIVRAVVDHFF
jgi:hypothetical protein